MLGKMACFFGLHKWNNGEWIKDSGIWCIQVKTCQRCFTRGERELLSNHEFNNWSFQLPDSCIEIRICKQCDYVDSRVRHEWGDWQYVAPDSCIQERACYRDNQKETRHAPHVWGTWGDDTSNPCNQIRTCTRCNDKESRESHDWGDWKDKVRSCKKCGTTDYDSSDDYYDNDSDSGWAMRSINIYR